MSPTLIMAFIAAYFVLLFIISYLTSKDADNDTFFVGNRNSKWYLVAFGMIGASLSGVTFISVPGWVGTSQFSYMQLVFGYLIGYFVIATVLMPMYYRMNLTSIYSYLGDRYGAFSYKTGASFFLLSKIIGAAFRLYLVANVLQLTIFSKWGIPFSATVILTIFFILSYTFKAGIRTIIYTDTLQTIFMLVAVVASIILICTQLNYSISDLYTSVESSPYSRIFFFDDFNDGKYFWKQFLSGIFIAICMTGLDQDMMQKNLSCRNIGEAQKNMLWFSVTLVFVNFFFLTLGALLYIYCSAKSIPLPASSDDLYPILATQGYLGVFVGIFFIIGLIAAAYSSADSALTALTTSLCVDFIDIKSYDKKSATTIRQLTHVLVALVMVIVILFFKDVNKDNVISAVFKAAGYTYGPLLGLYSFGLFTKWKVRDRFVPIVCILSPIICYVLNENSVQWFDGYKFSFEILLLNGVLTFTGLLLLTTSQKKEKESTQ